MLHYRKYELPSRKLDMNGVAVDSVPLGMSVSLYATILQFLRSCLVTICTIRTSVRKKHNWLYGKSNGSKYLFENSFKKRGFST